MQKPRKKPRGKNHGDGPRGFFDNNMKIRSLLMAMY